MWMKELDQIGGGREQHAEDLRKESEHRRETEREESTRREWHTYYKVLARNLRAQAGAAEAKARMFAEEEEA